MTIAVEIYETYFAAGLKPTENLTVSRWADLYRILPKRAGAKEPGKWRTNRAPYLREIMDNLGPQSPVQQVKVIKGTQLGFTEAGNNWVGFTIHIDPAPIMQVQPSLDVAKRHSKTRLAPTIEETPVLRSRIDDPRSRDSGNTTLYKEFPGGYLVIAGANSAASLRSLPVKRLMLDEIDAYDADLEGEGDVCSIAEKRTDTFGVEKKIYKLSTPTIKGLSKIEAEFIDSDQRYYYVPCPHCGAAQILTWPRLAFAHVEYVLQGEVVYTCEHCQEPIHEYHKTAMLENGQWRPHNPGHEHRGYHLSSLYSPVGWLSWRDIVREFLHARKENDIALLKTWTNTRLAETWNDEDSPIVDDGTLFSRREDYGPVLPMQVVVLTAGVDTQDDRLECEIKGWAPGEESWTIDYRVFHGNPGRPDVWKELDDFLAAPFLHASGAEMKISCALIDSRGHFSQEVYDFVRPRQHRRIFASAGSQFPGKPIIERSKRQQRGRIRLMLIGTDTAKDTIFSRLLQQPLARQENELYGPLTDQPVTLHPAYMHFRAACCDEEYFKQLVSEKPEKKKVSGRWRRVYTQIRERNEALDIAVLCLAALRLIKPNWKQLIERLSIKAKTGPKMDLVSTSCPEAFSEQPAENFPASGKDKQITPVPAKHSPRRFPRRGGWVNGWR